MNKEIIILDIETTGLDIIYSEITEISAIKVNRETLEIIKEFSYLVDIKGVVPDSIKKLTGIDNDLISKNGKGIKWVLNKLSSFCGNREIYAHYAPFDKKFIRNALSENNIDYIETKWIDTIKIFKNKWPNMINYKLDTFIRKFGIAEKESHRGLMDAKHTLIVMRIAAGFRHIPNITNEYKMEKILERINEIATTDKENVKYPNETWITVTGILNNRFLTLKNNYIQSIKKYNKLKVIRGRERTTDVNPSSFIGTAMDQMVEYFYNDKEFLKRIKKDDKILPYVYNKFNSPLDINDFMAISFSISFFRSNDERYLNLAIAASDRDKILNEAGDEINWYHNLIREYLPIAKQQSHYLKKKYIHFNPVFGTIESGIQGDGDYIIDGMLCEMKTSKKPSFLISYKIQLITYILLNKFFTKDFKIREDKVIYWNPVYDIFEEMDICINKEIENEFIEMVKSLKALKNKGSLLPDMKSILLIKQIIFSNIHNEITPILSKENEEHIDDLYIKYKKT